MPSTAEGAKMPARISERRAQRQREAASQAATQQEDPWEGFGKPGIF